MFFFDPLYLIIMAPALLFMLYAQFKVSSTFSKYSKVASMRGVSGGDVARSLLRANRLDNVKIEETPGKLTDHYDPRNKTLRFSRDVYASRSVAALGIVAHEVGHAVQDQVGYPAMRLRAALVPVASVGTYLGYIFFFLGFILYAFGAAFGINLVWLGVVLFAGAVAFALVTLPVEYNASSRARQMLRANALVSEQEYSAASAVLSAAALTYVAALLQAMANLLYYVLIALSLGRQRD